MPEADPIDPYQPPAREVGNGKLNSAGPGSDLGPAIRQFLSPSGSFSRRELLIATVVLFAIAMLFSILHGAFPGILSPLVLLGLKYGLYLVWGVALGKRSRDLGTTFTYGMIVGLLFPILGLIFLFQEGAKSKARKSLPVGPPKP